MDYDKPFLKKEQVDEVDIKSYPLSSGEVLLVKEHFVLFQVLF